jgi:hypothetical protein
MNALSQLWHEAKYTAVCAGRRPVRALLGPDEWEFLQKLINQHLFLVIDQHINGHPPKYEDIPCYRMDTPGVAIITSPPPHP